MERTNKKPEKEAGQPCRPEEIEYLHALNRLTPAGRKRLLTWLHVRTYAADEPLFRQGEPALCLFFLLSGSLALEADSRTGRPDRLKIVAPGQACGSAALAGDAFYGESCLALEPSRIAVLPQTAFHQLLAGQPAIAAALLQGLLEETLDDWRQALRTYSGLTDHLTRANIIV